MTALALPRAFADGSVSLGLYLSEGGSASPIEALVADADAAIEGGFDGVSVAEHHGAQPGYVPNPVLVAAYLLGRLDRGWVAAAPTLATLRPAAALAEDVAWSALLSGGRFGVAFGVGYDLRDFEAFAMSFETRMAQFRDVTGHVARILEESEAIPLLVATRGPRNVRHAAANGLGLFLPPLTPAVAAALAEQYAEAGGAGPIVITRWIWLGQHPAEAEAAMNQSVAGVPGDLSWRDADAVIVVESDRDPLALGQRLAALVQSSGGTALNVRVRLPGVDHETSREQIGRIAALVLPSLQHELSSVGKERQL